MVRRAALAFAREIERRIPKLVTTAWWKEERGQQVFVDYNQNARDRTIRSAYSLRGEPGAHVSTPLTWDEVPYADPREFTIDTVPERFADLGDVHAGIDDHPWSIEPLLEWADRDERDRGLGDAPYPPNFPKMEGEPPRVQPSRAKRPVSEDTGRPSTPRDGADPVHHECVVIDCAIRDPPLPVRLRQAGPPTGAGCRAVSPRTVRSDRRPKTLFATEPVPMAANKATPTTDGMTVNSRRRRGSSCHL